jgi:hypothetical protein
MANHDPILNAAEGTMRQLLEAHAAPVSRLLAEVGTSFDLDAAQRADLADLFASQLHAEHIQSRLVAERATPLARGGARLGRSLKAIAALSVALAMLTVLVTLAAANSLTNARASLSSDVDSLDVRP